MAGYQVGELRNTKTGKKESVVLDPNEPVIRIKDLIIGTVLTVIGIRHLMISAFRHGGGIGYNATCDSMEKLGVCKLKEEV